MLTGDNLVSARDEQTKCVFGRASKPKSRWVYRAPEPVSGEAIAFDDRHDNCQSTWNYSKCTRSHRSNRH